MLKKLRNLLRPGPAPPLPALPPGHRVYAVGDIHGRADLFARLIAAIEDDNWQRKIGQHGAENAQGQEAPDDGAQGKTTMVLLGDLIDRGPDSRGVLKLAQDWSARRKVRILMGNHEEMLLKSLEKIEVLRHFLQFGGSETVLSFGVDEAAYHAASFEEVQAMLLERIPPAMIDFIRSFEDGIRIGDYLFVHAGIRPGVPIEEQKTEDLRWIREPFLSSMQEHGAVVVHGHTIADEAVVRGNRLGIDTGAYQSGRLTALGLEGERRWLIQAVEQEAAGGITVTTQALN